MTEAGPRKPRAARAPSEAIQRILDAAQEEFGSKGFDGTKIEHIARRAKVSKQLVYLYFSTKDELYGEMAKSIAEQSYVRLLAIDFTVLSPEDALRTYIDAIHEEYQAHPAMAVIHMDQSVKEGAQVRLTRSVKLLREQFWGRLDEMLGRCREAGIVDADLDVETLEFLVVVNVTGCVLSRGMFSLFLGRKADGDEGDRFWREHASHFLLRALRK